MPLHSHISTFALISSEQQTPSDATDDPEEAMTPEGTAMKGFSISQSSILALLLIYNASAFTSVKVKLHDTATLPCSHTCSGLVTWTVSHKPRDILAQCDQTSCQSKEGFHMSHDQYLKGDHSLTITDVDYSKRTWYTCTCNSKDICDVSLRIEAVHVHKTVSPGKSLSMDVPVSGPVEVTLNMTRDTKSNTVRLCEINERELQCDPEYEKRVSFNSSLQLMDLKESDSGIYIIRDIRNDDIIVTYTVTVGGREEEPENSGMWVLPVVLSLVLLVLLVSLVVLLQNRKNLQNCWFQNEQPEQQEMDQVNHPAGSS